MGASSTTPKVTLDVLRQWKRDRRKFAMVTAYDYPLAAAAEAAGVPTVLIGDSMASVVLGHGNTRAAPLDVLLVLGRAVRLGAPSAYLVGDIPFISTQGGVADVVDAGRRYRDDVGCQAVKIETGRADAPLVEGLAKAGMDTIAHLGLRPQTVVTPDGYRAQARDQAALDELVADARAMVAAGAVMLLLEAVPTEASAAVCAAVDVPIIGCGAGSACDGHVVVTYDMLGYAVTRPPRFVPVLENFLGRAEAAMREWRRLVESGEYPSAEQTYGMRRQP